MVVAGILIAMYLAAFWLMKEFGKWRVGRL